jgi:transcriptional regulator with GAF, ATPase, and Fis domain
VGGSAPLAALRREIAAVAPLESTVLLLGETGTGKGVVARLLHAASARADGPFVHVDCAALSPALIESELFGHERGAFTGAVERRAGRFELARNGTVFLDEIGDLEPRLQSKLLRVLQDREYERLGGSRTLPMTARVVAATSHDLREAVERGRFRRDLYFRLNVFPLRMPPLRERLEDLPLLVRAGLERVSRRLGMATPAVGEGLHAALRAHDWPGNVRELMNVLERLVVRGRCGPLEAADWQGARDDPPRRDTGERLLQPTGDCASGDGIEARTRPRDAIAGALAGTGGNVARAARRLGVPRSTLRYWIQQHGLAELVPRD